MAQACESLRATLRLTLKHEQGLCWSASPVILQGCGTQSLFGYPGQDFLNRKGYHIQKKISSVNANQSKIQYFSVKL